jgi:hypothetical protein
MNSYFQFAYINYKKHCRKAIIAHAQKHVAVHVHHTLLIVASPQINQAEHHRHNLKFNK